MKKDSKSNSEKQKKQWLITSVLLVIFAFTFTKNVLMRFIDNKKPMTQEGVSAIQNLSEDLVFVTNLRSKDKQFADQKKIWEKEWGRDPFEPQATSAQIVKAVNLTLSGILWDEKTPKVIVNEKVVSEGDSIYGYTVLAIKPKSVVLKTGEKNIELRVFNPVGDPSQAKS